MQRWQYGYLYEIHAYTATSTHYFNVISGANESRLIKGSLLGALDTLGAEGWIVSPSDLRTRSESLAENDWRVQAIMELNQEFQGFRLFSQHFMRKPY
jgi:hypothetical protein